jgi:uncharacterized protein (DUF1697 family)
MDRYVAFLRGMNLGARRITNEELRAQFEALGFEEVATFRASGNVVFSTDTDEGEETLGKGIEKGLGAALGYEVPVFLRSCAEVVEIAAREPFDATMVAASEGKLQVSLLMDRPSAKARKAVLTLASDEDLLAVEGREVYWLPSGGILDSPLNLRALHDAVGVDTRRTMGTIEQIAARYCG